MHEWLAELLVEPVSGAALQLEVDARSDESEIEQGSLMSQTGHRFGIRDGIPRFASTSDAARTSASFAFKWSQRSSYESVRFRQWYTDWLLSKYGFRDQDECRRYFSGRRRVLEIGCGSGLSSVISRAGLGSGGEWVGLDLTAAVDVAQAQLGRHADAGFVQADLMAAPFAPGTFDTVFTEGVLHHTPSTEAALAAAVSLLEPDGEILFYIYARKAPVREWTDDYIRSIVSELPAEDAWERVRPLTSLARALAELDVSVNVPEDVPLLGIKAGRHDVQRLIYWHFAKLFWNAEMGLEGSQHVNFDWYHPPYAHRHTSAEILDWCERLGLRVSYRHDQESGYTIRAKKV